MRITDIEAFAISIPLQEAVMWSTAGVTQRDHVIVRVHTDENISGIGYSLGYSGSALIARSVETLLKPLLIGQDPLMTEHLWETMFHDSIKVGRRGVLLRAISAIDIALWDIRGRRAGLPLYKLLGGHRTRVPAYASGGYYYPTKGVENLAAEMKAYVDAGFKAVKMKVGRLSLKEEVQRVRAARGAIGDQVELLLDANCAWADAQTAIRFCKAFEAFSPFWIEEPTIPDRIAVSAEIKQAINIPIATGETESTRWAFADLIRQKAADILQPDVTIVGGISEWLKVAHMASALDVKIAPHYNADIHVHLVAAIPNGLFVEFFDRAVGIKVFDDVLRQPLKAKDGYLEVPERPGLGIEFDEEALRRFRIA